MSAHSDTVVDPQTNGLERLLSGYAPLAGIFDEMMDADGDVRPHWQPFLTMLASLGADEINRRFAAADRYLRDSGVFYRVYEDPAGAERPWPLSHLPLIINPAEWEELKTGLVQRAELLEKVLADAYGPGHLVRDRHVPAALIAGNPEFLRPLVGVAPPGGSHLHFYAVDVGRGADGRWWVLGDRTQAPSGAGYRAGEPTRLVARHSRCLSCCCGWNGSRRFSRHFRPSCRRSTARTIRGSACSRPGR